MSWFAALSKTKCPECDRVFDLLDEEEASEFAYGHDCQDLGDESYEEYYGPRERDWDAVNEDKEVM